MATSGGSQILDGIWAFQERGSPLSGTPNSRSFAPLALRSSAAVAAQVCVDLHRFGEDALQPFANRRRALALHQHFAVDQDGSQRTAQIVAEVFERIGGRIREGMYRHCLTGWKMGHIFHR